MTIEEFLLARITEDEAVATAAIEPAEMHPYGDTTIQPTPPEKWGDDVIGYLGGTWGIHAANWNPLRVLAECKTKRAVLTMHAAEDWGYPHQLCATCADWDDEQMGEGPPPVKHPCPTIRAIAAVYAGHPSYVEDWKA